MMNFPSRTLIHRALSISASYRLGWSEAISQAFDQTPYLDPQDLIAATALITEVRSVLIKALHISTKRIDQPEAAALVLGYAYHIVVINTPEKAEA